MNFDDVNNATIKFAANLENNGASAEDILTSMLAIAVYTMIRDLGHEMAIERIDTITQSIEDQKNILATKH